MKLPAALLFPNYSSSFSLLEQATAKLPGPMWQAMLKERKTQLFTLKIKKQMMQLQNTSELRIAKGFQRAAHLIPTRVRAVQLIFLPDLVRKAGRVKTLEQLAPFVEHGLSFG